MAQAPKKGAAKPAAHAPKKEAVKPAATAEHDDRAGRASGDLVVSAKLADFDKVVSIEYNFGANLDEMSELFTPDVTYNKALDSMVIDAQSKLRRHLRAELVGDKEGKKMPLPKDVQSLFADWKPSAGGKERKSAAEKVQVLVGKLSAEERIALIARLRAGE